MPFNKGHGVLLCAPDLLKTPPTNTKLLENLDEVNKCLASVEERVKSISEMQSLYKLRDEVYKGKEMPFHWGRDDCVELKGQFLHGESVECDESGEDERAALEINDILRHTYEYRKGNMVAVKASSREFWIAEILDVYSNENGEPADLLLRWYEVRGKAEKDPYEASYKPAVLSTGRGTARENKPWTDKQSTETVMVCFEKLNAKNKLPANASKRIRECFH